MMWSNAAFGIYMGLHDAVTAAEFEPARRREVLLGHLADTQRVQPVHAAGPRPSRLARASRALGALTTGRRLARG